MQKLYRASFVLALLVTAGVVCLRVFLLPELVEPETDTISLSYSAIALIAAFLIAAFVLCLRAKVPYSDIPAMKKPVRQPVAAALILSGAVLLVNQIVDAVLWASTGKTPPPNETLLKENALDRITLVLTILFGAAAGAFLLYMGVLLLLDRVKRSSSLALGALLPVLWIWVRIVRYEISFATAIRVLDSFYTFVMLIFIMLFIYSLSKHIAGVGRMTPQWRMMLYALGAAVMSLSGTVTQVLYGLVGLEIKYTSQILTVTDFAFGVLALVVAGALAFTRPALPKKAPSPVVETETPTVFPHTLEELVGAEEPGPAEKDSGWTRAGDAPAEEAPDKQTDPDSQSGNGVQQP